MSKRQRGGQTKKVKKLSQRGSRTNGRQVRYEEDLYISDVTGQLSIPQDVLGPESSKQKRVSLELQNCVTTLSCSSTHWCQKKWNGGLVFAVQGTALVTPISYECNLLCVYSLVTILLNLIKVHPQPVLETEFNCDSKY